MVKVGLNIVNGSKIKSPKVGDVIIFDGKDWYITTKEDLFREYDERFSNKLEECSRKIAEMDARNVQVAEQMLKFENIIAELIKKGE